jgi:hypothetical protein
VGRRHANPFNALADADLKNATASRVATGGNILPAMTAYKRFPGMEGAAYYYFGIPKNPVNEAMVASTTSSSSRRPTSSRPAASRPPWPSSRR